MAFQHCNRFDEQLHLASWQRSTLVDRDATEVIHLLLQIVEIAIEKPDATLFS